jgi:tripartite-type tricarboxylate transporter receptor subunit TctC
MEQNHSRRRASLLCAAALCAYAALSCAADKPSAFPARPIHLIVGFTPGGGSDVAARIVGQKLGDMWNQPIVVDNRPGGGGNIATEMVARATADGYTLLLAGSSFAIQASLDRTLPFDSIRDFTAVTNLCATPFMLVVNPSLPAKSVKELIALAHAKPGALNYASAGTGSTVHLAVEPFRNMANLDIVHVPYKGVTGITDLISGAVQLTITAPLAVMPHVKAGRLRALGVTSAQRTAIAPDLPTIAESGLKGYEVESWYGVVAPARTPAAIVATLNSAILKVLERADVKDQLLAQGLEQRPTTPAAFNAYIKTDIAKWASVIKASGIKIE